MKNHLQQETSPYLLQHAENPVDWYPWGEAAFRRAKEEDKPIFLSIGYSTCHWCHVMAHESFEDEKIAELLNQNFISIKVDKEERPDIDSIYMAVCQAFTGSGGWPTSIFMTPAGEPFFAGTYFPKKGRWGMTGMEELLTAIIEMWKTDRQELLEQASLLVEHLRGESAAGAEKTGDPAAAAVEAYRRSFDEKHGGFGPAPKFPTPHNLLFLLAWYERRGEKDCLMMVEKTLTQMARGGIFDHIGGGFCRYSTDAKYLAPHFEKMLYDNALLMMTYAKAHVLTQNPLYLQVAERTAAYVLREMTDPAGGFYSAQDADSEGVEGKFYLFDPEEVIGLLGQEKGEAFCRRYDITPSGNFEGKSIPNLLLSEMDGAEDPETIETLLAYRKERCALHLDDKVLTVWNSLMIGALARLYQASGKAEYLEAALKAETFLDKNLWDGDNLHVSYRSFKPGVLGFVDDYAAYAFAQLLLYEATLDPRHLKRAQELCNRALADFEDKEKGGFFLYSHAHESLILRPKETYDGAIPSGNGLMAWNLVRLWNITADDVYGTAAERQLEFLKKQAQGYPAGHSMFLLSYLEMEEPSPKITVVFAGREPIPVPMPMDTISTVLSEPTKDHPLKDNKNTYYVCRGHICLPPENELKL